MTKHIREALKLAGLRLSDVVIVRTPKGHPHICVNGKTVVASCSPRNPDSAARLIARDLRRALNT